jgi:tight adherence protein C
MFGLGGCLLAYVVPGILLARLAKKRQHKIQLSLADALDLLVVSVEAGLGLDQAILRVGEELAPAHPELSDELRLVNLELRAGKGRSEALRNLADRTGLEDIGSLVTMLVQTDKFGTSVAQSLRVHSETLRTKRRQRAEEAAAKTGVKMVFPLVFCIFPSIWVVTIGPAAIKFVEVLFPMAQNIKH